MNINYVKIMAILALGATLIMGCSEDRPPVEQETSADTGACTPQFDSPYVPQTCERAQHWADEGKSSSAGCEFFSTSLDVVESNFQYALVLGNVNQCQSANFSVWGSVWDYETNEGDWQELTSGTISPLGQRVVEKDLAYLHLNDNKSLYLKPDKLNPKALMKGGAYKIVSDVPIIAYQFNPLNRSGSFSSDASMLLPKAVWATDYQVVGYRSVDGVEAGFGPGHIQYNLAYFAVVAGTNDTVVNITPSATIRQGYEDWESDVVVLDGGTDDVEMTLNEGDVLYIHADVMGESLSGSTVESNHPVALFSGHQCALIPDYAAACDNVEEQLPGVKNWGKEFVAARLPNRNRTSYTDPVMWQIYASEENTTITVSTTDQVRGISDGEIVLNKGEVREFYVYGSVKEPGDFTLVADKAIAVLQYMTGGQLAVDADGETLGVGDPTMSYLPPREQYLDYYIVNIPSGWAADYVVLTREAGSDVFLDGIELDDEEFIPVGDGPFGEGDEAVSFEAARIVAPDGYHILNGDAPFGVTVAGFDEYDSYAYTGGMGFTDLTPVE